VSFIHIPVVSCNQDWANQTTDDQRTAFLSTMLQNAADSAAYVMIQKKFDPELSHVIVIEWIVYDRQKLDTAKKLT
jgi:hypothetical protein